MTRRQYPVSGLPRFLAAAYTVLVAYACLHPFSGWRDTGLSPFDFLSAPWPRYYTTTDLLFNILGFLPLGFVAAPALPERLAGRWTVLLVTLLCALFSLGLETTQNYLPSRVASNLDLACNTLGAFLGAIAGVLLGHPLFARDGGLHRWREQHILGGARGDWGLVLLGLWLLAQLAPDALPFVSGDLRQLLGLPAPLPFTPERYINFEAAVTGFSILAAGLLAARIQRQPTLIATLALIVLAALVKCIASAAFLAPTSPLDWLTPGTRSGLLFATPLLLALILLPATLRQALSGTALATATVLVNLMPENPYHLVGEHLRIKDSFLNFHGLTELTSSLWPFLALAYLGLNSISSESRDPAR